jgi:magnesium transporter
MQLFVYDDTDFVEYQDIEPKDLKKSIDISKTSWLNIHVVVDIPVVEAMPFQIDNFIIGYLKYDSAKLEESANSLFLTSVHIAS